MLRLITPVLRQVAILVMRKISRRFTFPFRLATSVVLVIARHHRRVGRRASLLTRLSARRVVILATVVRSRRRARLACLRVTALCRCRRKIAASAILLLVGGIRSAAVRRRQLPHPHPVVVAVAVVAVVAVAEWAAVCSFSVIVCPVFRRISGERSNTSLWREPPLRHCFILASVALHSFPPESLSSSRADSVSTAGFCALAVT